MRVLLVQIFLIGILSGLFGLGSNLLRSKPLDWIRKPSVSRKLTPPAPEAGTLENPNHSNTEQNLEQALTLDEIKAHIENGTAVLIDARKKEQYILGHLMTATNLPSVAMEAQMDQVFPLLLGQDLPIIIYCEGAKCEASHDVFDFLAENGIETSRMQIFLPGWLELEKLTDFIVAGQD